MTSNTKSSIVIIVAILSAVVVPVAGLLVAYGYLTTEKAELWVALLIAALGAIGGIFPASVGQSFNKSRTEMFTAALESNNLEAIDKI